TYLYKDSHGKKLGTEQWELFGLPDGGRLVRSQITVGNLTTEVFHRIDGKRRPTLVEVTKRQGEGLARARYSLDGQTLLGRLRGNQSGIISQTLSLPEYWTLSSPAVAAEGWGSLRALEAPGVKSMLTYFAPHHFTETMGLARMTVYEARGEE